MLQHGKLLHSAPNSSHEEYCDSINEAMSFPDSLKLDPKKVDNNKFIRNHYKILLCSFLGKFAQQNLRTETKFVRSQTALAKLFFNEEIEDITCLDKVCHVLIKSKRKKSSINRDSNSVIYSYLTAYARVFMHKEMIKIWSLGGIIFCIENDCLYFTRSKNEISPLTYSKLFGTFKIECSQIISFISFGAKSSALTYLSKNELKQKIKARGFSLESNLVNELIQTYSFHELLDQYLLQNNKKSIKVPQIRAKRNLNKLTITERIQIHELSNIIVSTRVIFNNYATVPYGYVKRQ